jgi:hypothetical protein
VRLLLLWLAGYSAAFAQGLHSNLVESELKSMTVRALAYEVVVGLLSATSIR